jgi:4-hydroxy-tetrahydrodipicolinate reductase
MKIYVIGSGKLANAILSSSLIFNSISVTKWDPKLAHTSDKSILIHAGSGRELKTCLQFCKKTGSVLIELSTGLETETMTPDFPLIVCPNTSIPVLRALLMLKSTGNIFERSNVSILESHQSTKTTPPGTAYRFAEFLNVPIERIVSVRDPEVQLKLGIDKEHLEKHAFHRITITDGSDQVTIETKVQGHESYSAGVKRIVQAALTHPLENRKYDVMDLLENGWL